MKREVKQLIEEAIAGVMIKESDETPKFISLVDGKEITQDEIDKFIYKTHEETHTFTDDYISSHMRKAIFNAVPLNKFKELLKPYYNDNAVWDNTGSYLRRCYRFELSDYRKQKLRNKKTHTYDMVAIPLNSIEFDKEVDNLYPYLIPFRVWCYTTIDHKKSESDVDPQLEKNFDEFFTKLLASLGFSFKTTEGVSKFLLWMSKRSEHFQGHKPWILKWQAFNDKAFDTYVSIISDKREKDRLEKDRLEKEKKKEILRGHSIKFEWQKFPLPGSDYTHREVNKRVRSELGSNVSYYEDDGYDGNVNISELVAAEIDYEENPSDRLNNGGSVTFGTYMISGVSFCWYTEGNSGDSIFFVNSSNTDDFEAMINGLKNK